MFTWAFEAISEGMHASRLQLSNYHYNYYFNNSNNNNSIEHPHEGAATGSDAPPFNYIKKEKRNGTLYGADGTTELCCHCIQSGSMDGQHKDEVSTWRSHHTFGARCALVNPTSLPLPGSQDGRQGSGGKAAATDEAQGKPRDAPAAVSTETAAADEGARSGSAVSFPAWVNVKGTDYDEWEAAFYLKAKSSGSTTAQPQQKEDDPHFLLSVAPFYYCPGGEQTANGNDLCARPCTREGYEHYKHHMLDTPLIWEEPFTVSLDVNKNGIFLWSEHLQLFSRRVVFRPPPHHPTEVKGESTSTPREGLVLRQADHHTDGAHASSSYYDTRVGLKWVRAANADYAKLYVSYNNNSTSADGKDREWVHATEAINFPLYEEDHECYHEQQQQAMSTQKTTAAVASKLFFFCPYVTLLEGGQEALIV